MADKSNIPTAAIRWNNDDLDGAIPVVAARRSRDRHQLIIQCPYCGKTHYHGAVDPGRRGAGDGHRQAHCSTATERSQKGYIIAEVAGDAEVRQW